MANNDLKITASLNDNLSTGLNKIAENLGKTQKQAENAKKSMNGLLNSVGEAQNVLGGLQNALKSGNFLGFGQLIIGASQSVTGLTGAMGTATAGATTFGGALKALGASAWAATGPIGLIVAAVAGLGVIGYKAASAANELDKHLDSLQSLTGLDDTAMKDMSKSAIQMSKDFGTAAADVVDSMKLIGSQAPELLKDQEGLKSVTEAANVLAKAGEIEVVDAAKAITGTMNQMGASAEEASNIINVLAAGAKEGSKEIADLNEVFGKAGTMAKSSGMNYTELAALVEAVGGKFEEASVLGTSLNSTLIALSVQGNDKFKPAVVGMQQAIENMAAAQLTDQQMKDLVGASNVKLLKSMIEMKGEYERLQGAITGTNAAYEMAEKNTDNMDGTIAKLKASWDALLITIGQSSIMQGIIKLFQMWAEGAQEVINTISGVLDELPKFSGGIGIFEALAAVLKVIGGLFKVLWELIGVGVSVIIQIWNGLFYTVTTILKGIWGVAKDAWDSIKKIFADNTIFQGFIAGINKVIGFLKMLKSTIAGIGERWNELKRNLGMNVPEPKKKEEKKETKKTETTKTTNTEVTLPGNTTKTKSVKVKVEAEPGSIDALKKKLSDLQKSLTSKKLSVVDIEKTKQQIEGLQEEIDKKEMELGIKAKPGSLEYIENEISKIDAKLKKLDPKIDFVLIQKLKVERQDLEDLKKEVEDALKPIEVTVVRKAIRNIDEIDPKTISRDEATEVLSQLNSDLNKETDKTSENYQHLIDRIKKWTAVKEEKDIEINADLSNASEGSMKWLQDKEAYWNGKLQLTAYGTPEYYEALKNVDYYTKEEQKLKMKIELDTAEASEKFDNFIEGFNQITAPLTAIDGLVGSFESLSKAIDEGANAWEVLMGVLDIVNQAFQTIQQTMQMVEFIEKLLGTTTQTTTAIQQTAAATSQATAATEVAAATTTVAAKSGESIASATASGAKMPFPLNLIAIAAGVAAVLSAFAMIGSFATGGIVGGNSYHGDKLTARVNSGEMILNGHQQKNLFDAINSGKIGGGNALVAGEVKVKGSDLYIALKNYGKTQAIIGKNIGIH